MREEAKNNLRAEADQPIALKTISRRRYEKFKEKERSETRGARFDSLVNARPRVRSEMERRQEKESEAIIASALSKNRKFKMVYDAAKEAAIALVREHRERKAMRKR